MLWVHESFNDAAPAIIFKDVLKIGECKNPFNFSIFKDQSELVMRQMGTEPINQVLQPSLTLHIFAKKDPRISKLFKFLFRD